jgi:hypothetical protein
LPRSTIAATFDEKVVHRGACNPAQAKCARYNSTSALAARVKANFATAGSMRAATIRRLLLDSTVRLERLRSNLRGIGFSKIE